ncbi:MAG: ABC transporter permease [Gemmatimonadetes bacterium]|nr:ABC transporter permease [Gemmatimonadota bacterium]
MSEAAARRDGRFEQLREAARLAFDVMRAHRLRSALLVLGVAIGVTVLMAMVAILSGVSKKIEREMKSSDRDVVTVSKYDFLTEGPDEEKVLARPDLVPEDAIALEELCPSVDLAEFYVDANRATLLFRGDKRTRPTFVTGVGTRVLDVWNLPIARGRNFIDPEIRHRENVVFLGAGPADDLFPMESPIGKRVRLGDDHYKVIGVGEKRKSLFGPQADNYALIPWSTYRKNLGRRNDPYGVYLTVAPGATVDDVVQEARTVMRQRRALRPGDKDDFAITPSAKIEEFVSNITGQVGLVLLVLSSIGLTVGGIGVMNLMLVSVTERTREIGIRMALGARRGTILAQFLVEAGTLTGIGGIVGSVLGFTVAFVLGKATGLPTNVSPWVALIGILFSAGIGVFFGMYPAWRASRLDPITALRYE